MSFDLAEIQARATELKIVDGYAVASPAEAVSANSTLTTIKELARQVERAKRDELSPLSDQEREIRTRYREAEQLLARAEGVVKNALLAFSNAERKRIADENAAREAAAAKEQARLRAEAEEVRRKAAAKAAELEAAGKSERAAATLAVAEAKASAVDAVATLVPATVASVRPTELAGFSSSTRWVGSVTDVRAFLAWLAGNDDVEPADLIDFKKAGLNRLASLFKKADTVPGFKSTPDQIARSA